MYPKGGTTMFGLLAIFGDLGASLGPWLAGIVSDVAQKSTKLANFGHLYNINIDQIGLKSGLLAAMFFPIMLVIGILLIKEENNQFNECNEKENVAEYKM
jgi:hypothetical protein